ncbi:MAG: hypothetical protein EOP83_33770, partial [Verrucomicrobiaceae bacterium]
MSHFDSNTDTATGNGYALTAFFDKRDDAQEAVQKLRDLGVSSESISLTEGRSTSSTTAAAEQHTGFFDALANLFMPDEDRYTYAEGLNRGGYLVTVSNMSLGLYDEALNILDHEGAIDIDERAESWRSP